MHELFMRRDVGGVGGPVVRRPGWSPGTARTARYIVYISQEARIRVSENDEYAYLNSRG